MEQLYALVPIRVPITGNCAAEINRAHNLVEGIIELVDRVAPELRAQIEPRKPHDPIEVFSEING